MQSRSYIYIWMIIRNFILNHQYFKSSMRKNGKMREFGTKNTLNSIKKRKKNIKLIEEWISHSQTNKLPNQEG